MLTLQTLTGKLILTSPCQNRLGLNLTDFKFMAKESEFADHLLRQSGERAARAECDSLTACPLPTLANAPRGPPQPPPKPGRRVTLQPAHRCVDSATGLFHNCPGGSACGRKGRM